MERLELLELEVSAGPPKPAAPSVVDPGAQKRTIGRLGQDVRAVRSTTQELRSLLCMQGKSVGKLRAEVRELTARARPSVSAAPVKAKPEERRDWEARRQLRDVEGRLDAMEDSLAAVSDAVSALVRLVREAA